MSLWTSKIVYLFLDAADLSSQREFFEDVIGVEVVENTFRPPHHRHGVVKYDAGDMLLALNVADAGFEPAAADRVVIEFAASPMREAQIYARLQAKGLGAPQVKGDIFTDADGRRYAVSTDMMTEPWRLDERAPAITALRYEVDDLADSVNFYTERLGLYPTKRDATSAEFDCNNVSLVLTSTGKGQPPRFGFLTVFHTPDVEDTCARLRSRGLTSLTDVRFSQIGGTARFKDPTGHRFCLYQPSAECLTWESGPTLTRIIDAPGRVATSGTVQ